MSFINASQPKLQFINGWGNRARTWNVLDYFLRASAANTRINLTDQQFINEPGQPRFARIGYVPLQCETDAACGAGLCATGTPIAPVIRNFEITQCTASKTYQLKQSDIRLTDNGDWDVNGYALEMIGSIMPDFRKQVALDMLTYAYTKTGRHSDGSTSKRLPLITNQVNGTPTPTGVWSVEREYSDAGFDMPYILGGGQDFYNYRKSVEIGSADQNGMLINRLPNDNTWYDEGLQAQLFNNTAAGDWALAIDPQMFKLVFYYANVGEYSTDLKGISNINQLFKGASGPGRDFILSTMQDPASGMTFDFFANFDKCTQTWNWHIEVNWDMFTMPDINCGPAGFNGITVWRTCPQLEVSCPPGSPVASPTAQTTFNWNPAFAYPFVAYSAVIGGVASTFPEGVTLTADADTVAFMNDAYGGAVFTLNGSNIQYKGYSAITGNFNNGQVTLAFA